MTMGLFLTSAKPVAQKSNNSWITLSGTIKDVAANSFDMHYGKDKKKTILVEFDDGDRDADAYKLVAGDKVTITGRLDKDVFENAKIEALSVHVENIGTIFYASAIDEEDHPYSQGIFYPAATWGLPSATVSGKVVTVSGRNFNLKTENGYITVDTSAMKKNPMDDIGYLKVDIGDFVSVHGTVSNNFFIGRKFEAQSINEYFSGSKKKNQSGS